MNVYWALWKIPEEIYHLTVKLQNTLTWLGLIWGGQVWVTSWLGPPPGQRLTQQYDDADENSNDGSSAQSRNNQSLHAHTVSVVVTLTDLHLQVGQVGHGQVSRVCDCDGNLVDPTGQGADPQPELGIFTCGGKIKMEKRWGFHFGFWECFILFHSATVQFMKSRVLLQNCPRSDVLCPAKLEILKNFHEILFLFLNCLKTKQKWKWNQDLAPTANMKTFI